MPATFARAATAFVAVSLLLSTSAPRAEEAKIGSPEKAIKKYSDAVKVAPTDPDNWFNLALAYKLAKKWKEGVEPALKAVELAPENARARVQAGEILKGAGRPDEAVKQLEEAVKLDATVAVAHVLLGDAYFNSDRQDDAITAYKSAIKADSTLGPSLWDDLGACYLKKGSKDDMDQAKKYLGKSVEASPNDPAAHYNMGMTYRQLSEKYPELNAQAADEFAKSSDLDPKDAKAAFFAGECALFAKRNDAAKKYLDRYLSLDPDGKRSSGEMNALAKSYREEMVK